MSAYNPFLPYDDSRDADESTKDHTVEFDKLVQKLNRAYCDAYMTALKYSAVGDRYIFLDFNCGPHSAKISDVSRPSATGEGGGVKLEPECMGGDYIETFNALRAEVDQTVKRYRDLPSGSSMHDTCSKCDSWARALSPREEDNFETVAGWIEATKRPTLKHPRPRLNRHGWQNTASTLNSPRGHICTHFTDLNQQTRHPHGATRDTRCYHSSY